MRRLLDQNGKFRKRTEAEVWAMIQEDIVPVPWSGCHLWTGPATKNGYGMVVMNRQKIYMHRLMYERHCGPIPGGMNVCHACDVPCCVNPDHLWLGTFKENHEDKARKGRGRGGNMQGMKHKMHKLTDQQVLEIRAKYAAGGMTQVQLARQYGVNQPSISAIILRQMWRHI